MARSKDGERQMTDRATPRTPYTGRQTEEVLGISSATRYRMIDKGLLPSFMIGGRRVHPADAVDRIATEGVALPQNTAA